MGERRVKMEREAAALIELTLGSRKSSDEKGGCCFDGADSLELEELR